jgi:hypothetical protein
MNRITTTTAILAAAALGTATVATAAEAPVVSKQRTLTTHTAPVTIPGTGVKKGEKLPAGARIVARTVTLEGEQTVRFNLKAPKGKTLRGLAVRDSQDVGFAVASKGSYVGHTAVTVRAYLDPKADGESKGVVYALAR